MPSSLSNVAIQQFHDNFTNVYQGAAHLGDTTQSVFNAVGDAYKWPIQGEGLMVARGAYQSLVPVSDLDYEQITTTFDNWVFNLPVDIYQQAELQIDVLSNLGETHAKAAGRREDQTVISALSSATLPAGNVIADDSKNMSVAKVVEASAILDEQNVDPDDRVLIVTPSQIQALMAEETATNTLYVNNRVLMNGQIDTFMGFKVITLGTRAEGGIPKAGNIRSCFAWQKSALGRAYSITPTTEIEWSAAHQSWLTISRMRLGASALLPKGIVEIKCDETA
jgi:hypothetical protein